MNDVLYLAWRYLAYHWIKTAILVSAITLIVFIPSALRVLVRQGEAQLTARAEATSLLLGAKDSPLELALNSLHFTDDKPDSIAFGEVAAVNDAAAAHDVRLVHAIPLHVRFSSRKAPIVGTTLDYFDYRELRVTKGRLFGRLGDCVIGADIARRRDLRLGGHVVSSPESVLGFADAYPLKMRITGVLAPSDSPDDGAVFVDVKTAWVIQGLAHGHQDLAKPEASFGVLRREGGKIIANRSVRQYQEITDENIDSFHFHGDISKFPITAVVAVPPDHKTKTMLLGDYGANDRIRLFEPRTVVDELLKTVFAVQNLVVAALTIVGATTLVLIVLVFMLSLRLRQQEIQTMVKIGAARGRLAGIICTEIVTVLASGILLASGLAMIVHWYGPAIVRAFLMS